jgi:threonine dehydratase
MSSTQPSTSATYTPPDWRAIVQAHARIAPRIHRTPVFTSNSLDAVIGARVFF